VKNNNKPSNIIGDREKEEGLLPEKTVSKEGHVIKKKPKIVTIQSPKIRKIQQT
jgi:hypothetical protein